MADPLVDAVLLLRGRVERLAEDLHFCPEARRPGVPITEAVGPGFGFGVSGLGFVVWGLGFKVYGLGFIV